MCVCVCTRFGMVLLALVLEDELGWMINREYRDEVLKCCDGIQVRLHLRCHVINIHNVIHNAGWYESTGIRTQNNHTKTGRIEID